MVLAFFETSLYKKRAAWAHTSTNRLQRIRWLEFRGIFLLKEQSNKTDFSILLYISVWHRSQLLKRFQFWLWIRGDFRIENRLSPYNESSQTLRVKDTEGRHLTVSVIWRVAHSVSRNHRVANWIFKKNAMSRLSTTNVFSNSKPKSQ